MHERRFIIRDNKRPDMPGMMLATLDALHALGGSAGIQEITEKAIEIEGVTEAEQAIPMSGKNARTSRVKYYFHWARSWLKIADAVINPSRGVWALTETGAAITTMPEARAAYQRAEAKHRVRLRARRQADRAETIVRAEPKNEAPKERESWKPELLSALDAMPPDAFERLMLRLLRKEGFAQVEVRGKSGDGGLDGVGVLRMNLVSVKIYFQCARWKGSVGAKEIRDLRGALQGRADKGLFVATGHFTDAASDEATRAGAITIDLIDGDRLCDLLKAHGLGVETKQVERVRIRRDWLQRI